MFYGWRFRVYGPDGNLLYTSDYLFESRHHARHEAVLYIGHYHDSDHTFTINSNISEGS